MFMFDNIVLSNNNSSSYLLPHPVPGWLLFRSSCHLQVVISSIRHNIQQSRRIHHTPQTIGTAHHKSGYDVFTAVIHLAIRHHNQQSDVLTKDDTTKQYLIPHPSTWILQHIMTVYPKKCSKSNQTTANTIRKSFATDCSGLRHCNKHGT
jgi:hypothetical protein